MVSCDDAPSSLQHLSECVVNKGLLTFTHVDVTVNCLRHSEMMLMCDVMPISARYH